MSNKMTRYDFDGRDIRETYMGGYLNFGDVEEMVEHILEAEQKGKPIKRILDDFGMLPEGETVQESES